MKTLRLLFLLIVAMIYTSCGTHQAESYYDYKSKVIGSELDGSYTIRAWGRARNAADAYVQAQKQAVYDIVFNGVDAASSSQSNLKPLLLEVNAKTKYSEYFDRFFRDGGEYTKYCSMKEKRVYTTKYSRTNSQTLSQTTVCVFRSKLKAKLIEDKILKQ